MLYPFMLCGRATSVTALRLFQGWPACRVGGRPVAIFYSFGHPTPYAMTGGQDGKKGRAKANTDRVGKQDKKRSSFRKNEGPSLGQLGCYEQGVGAGVRGHRTTQIVSHKLSPDLQTWLTPSGNNQA
jgi:hypothetical protein